MHISILAGENCVSAEALCFQNALGKVRPASRRFLFFDAEVCHLLRQLALNRCFPLDFRLPKSDLAVLWERREKVDGPAPEDLAERRPLRVASPAAEMGTRSRSALDLLIQFAFAAKALRRA